MCIDVISVSMSSPFANPPYPVGPLDFYTLLRVLARRSRQIYRLARACVRPTLTGKRLLARNAYVLDAMWYVMYRVHEMNDLATNFVGG
jgi:hypothetical protein